MHYIRRKYLLLIFKIKRLVYNFFSIKKLDYKRKHLSIYVQNIREYETRANSCKKEPETISWIEKIAKPGNIFYDIGANIGAYSLVAAVNGLDVYAFEPSYPNFYTLQRNISLNELDKKISALPIGFSEGTQIVKFKYLETTSGSSKSYYNKADRFHVAHNHLEAEKETLLFSLNDLIKIFHIPYPHAIKIDVDGAEIDVLRGAENVLKCQTLTTLLVEINEAFGYTKEILAILEIHNFLVTSKHRTSETTFNYIFQREIT